MGAVEFHTATRERLDDSIANGPAHLRPIMLAVRDAGCSFAIVTQGHHRFDIPTKRPTITVIGDDLHDARGPEGFHRKSLRRLLGRCRGVVIVSSEPPVVAYASAAVTAAGLRAHAVVIETRLEQEPAWLSFVEEHAPAASVLIASVEPAGGVH